MDRWILRVRASAILLLLAAVGCYSPGIQPCELACSANQKCPEGLACNGQNACAATTTAMCNELPIDAPMGDTVSSTVTIEVRDRIGGPLAAALVVFADPAGGPLVEMPTGADGKATADVPPGSSATVIRMVPRVAPLTGSDLHASTYLDLWPGAHIISQAEIDQRTRTVTFEIAAAPNGASTFSVYTSCTGVLTMSTPTIAVQVPMRCPLFDAIITASSATNPTPSFAAVIPAQTGPSVVVPTGAFKALRSVSGTVTGLPANAGSRIVSASGWATPGLPTSSRALAAAPVDATGTVPPLVVPMDAGLQTQLAVAYQATPGIPPLAQAVIERVPVNATAINRDYNSTLIQWVGNPVFDVATRRLTWPFVMPTMTTPAAPTFFAAVVTYNHDPNMSSIWRIIGDASRITTTGTQQSITYPDVPGMRNFEPISSDVVANTETITLFGVEPDAAHEVREILEPAGADLGHFKIPALRHLTVSIGQ